MVEVLYVDFGNIEDVPVTNLREPTEENVHVLSLPFQVLSCVITEKKTSVIPSREILIQMQLFYVFYCFLLSS